MSTTTYKIERLGRPIFKMSSKSLLMFSFGQEYSSVEACAVDTPILSSQMALINADKEAYISAQYRGLPGRCWIKFSGVKTKKPRISAN